jgi:hypothetical protein
LYDAIGTLADAVGHHLNKLVIVQLFLIFLYSSSYQFPFMHTALWGLVKYKLSDRATKLANTVTRQYYLPGKTEAAFAAP